MLVLSRHVGEEISIGNNIRVIVNRIGPNRVSLGIVAPQEVKVLRAELVGTEPENDDDKSEAA